MLQLRLRFAGVHSRLGCDPRTAPVTSGYKGFMEKILVSRCLLGQRVRYDGGAHGPLDLLLRWQAEATDSPPPPMVVQCLASTADTLDDIATVLDHVAAP